LHFTSLNLPINFENQIAEVIQLQQVVLFEMEALKERLEESEEIDRETLKAMIDQLFSNTQRVSKILQEMKMKRD
jgi:hypothetical protein